jgi:putative transposase
MASCTAEPNEAWVTQQARNLSWKLEDDGIKLSVLIRDRDKKFASKADVVFKSQAVRVIRTPLMASKANAQNRLEVVLGEDKHPVEALSATTPDPALRVREYCSHFNHERPPWSRNLRPPASRGDPIESARGIIRRRERLGGLLKAYPRAPLAA